MGVALSSPWLGWRGALLVSLVYAVLWTALDAVATLFQAERGVSLWYVPTGLTVALLLLGGLRYVPTVLATELLRALVEPGQAWPGVLLRAVVVTTVHAVAASLLLRRLGIDPHLRTQRDVTWFVVVACLAAPTLAALSSVAASSAAGDLPWQQLPANVAALASGTATGIGVLTPPVLLLARRLPVGSLPPLPSPRAVRAWIRRRHGHRSLPAVRAPRWETVGQAVALAGAVVVAYSGSRGSLDFTYAVFIPLIWIAVRGGFSHAVGAVVATNVLAVALVGRSAGEQPLRLQLSLVTLTLAGLLLGALVTQRRADTEQAEHAALHDPLTGLANRALLAERLHAAIHRADRNSDARPTVLYLDLDGFKGVNDTLGHDVGDALLVAAARRLETSVRPADLVVRLGGDELVVLLEDADPSQVDAVAARVLAAVRTPFLLGSHELAITTSVGVATLATDGAMPPTVEDDRQQGADGPGSAARRAERLLRAADAALQHAKRDGGDRAQRFTRPLLQREQRRLRIHAALRRALAGGGLTVVYQPILAVPDQRVLAMEALARWHDPDLGAVPPAEFIPVAEATGLIHELGLQVLETACQQAHRWWPSRRGDRDGLRVAVNVCPAQLVGAEFVERVLDALARSGLPPERLELEITESSAMEQAGPASAVLQQLSAAGIRIIIDDFGSGYSSFAALRDTAPDGLKMDRSFLAQVSSGDASTPGIVRAILALAAHLDVAVTAEGVETQAQLDLLRSLGCGAAQGFFLARPMDAAAASTWLEAAS